MTKQFELKMPQDVIDVFEVECCDDLGEFDTSKFANLCATWGANQEYKKSYEMIDEWWGSAYAEEYMNERRPKILTLKEEAIKAFEHILSHSESQLGMETVLKALQSLPDEGT